MHRATALRTCAAGVVAAMGLIGPAATPARAGTTTCTDWQKKEFATSGFDTDVEVRLCVADLTTSHAGYADIKWTDGGDYVKKFDRFDLNLRLERHDATQDTISCKYASTINYHESYSDKCDGLYVNNGVDGGWSVDGSVRYDYDADGEGAKTWSLHGTPVVN